MGRRASVSGVVVSRAPVRRARVGRVEHDAVRRTTRAANDTCGGRHVRCLDVHDGAGEGQYVSVCVCVVFVSGRTLESINGGERTVCVRTITRATSWLHPIKDV
jgi:hypothetical protein